MEQQRESRPQRKTTKQNDPLYANLLFDVDGCTAVQRDPTFKDPIESLHPSSKTTLIHREEPYYVEILFIGDAKGANQSDKDFGRSGRGEAVMLEKSRRGEDGEGGGYLEVWPQEKRQGPNPKKRKTNNKGEHVVGSDITILDITPLQPTTIPPPSPPPSDKVTETDRQSTSTQTDLPDYMDILENVRQESRDDITDQVNTLRRGHGTINIRTTETDNSGKCCEHCFVTADILDKMTHMEDKTEKGQNDLTNKLDALTNQVTTMGSTMTILLQTITELKATNESLTASLTTNKTTALTLTSRDTNTPTDRHSFDIQDFNLSDIIGPDATDFQLNDSTVTDTNDIPTGNTSSVTPPTTSMTDTQLTNMTHASVTNLTDSTVTNLTHTSVTNLTDSTVTNLTDATVTNATVTDPTMTDMSDTIMTDINNTMTEIVDMTYPMMPNMDDTMTDITDSMTMDMTGTRTDLIPHPIQDTDTLIDQTIPLQANVGTSRMLVDIGCYKNDVIYSDGTCTIPDSTVRQFTQGCDNISSLTVGLVLGVYRPTELSGALVESSKRDQKHLSPRRLTAIKKTVMDYHRIPDNSRHDKWRHQLRPAVNRRLYTLFGRKFNSTSMTNEQ